MNLEEKSWQLTLQTFGAFCMQFDPKNTIARKMKRLGLPMHYKVFT